MRTPGRRSGWLLVCALQSLGCVEPFRGSYVELLFERGAGVAGDATTPPPHPSLHASSLLSLHGSVEVGAPDRLGVLRLATFRLVPAVNPRSPCLIDAHGRRILRADCNDSQGAPPEDASICEFWKRRAGQLGARRSGVFAVVSASDGLRDAAGALLPPETTTVTVPASAGPVVSGVALTDAEIVLHSLVLREGDTALSPGCPPRGPTEFCVDYDGTLAVTASATPRTLQASYRVHLRAVPETATPAERLASCRQDFSRNPGHYVANARQLTAPLAGTFHGVSKAQDPSSGGFLGGAEIVTDVELGQLRAMSLVIENRDLAQVIATPYYRLADGAHAVFLAGRVTRPARGTMNLRLVEPPRPSSGQTLDVGVVTGLGDAPQQF